MSVEGNRATLSTPFTELVGCRVPIQSAPMGGVATPRLAAAVADAGGLGMIALHGAPADQVATALDLLAAATTGMVGMNFLADIPPDDATVDAAAQRCRVVEFFYDDPIPRLVERVHALGALACWQIGSVDEASAAVDAGCDLLVAQGNNAGGHIRGRVPLFPLLDAVLDRVQVPVLAAGGVITARNLAAVLAAGAAGARVGTRFVASNESDAHPDYIDALLRATSSATTITEKFDVNWPNAPARVLQSCLDAASALEGDIAGTTGAPESRPIPKFSPMAPRRGVTGRVDAMALYASQSVGEVVSVDPAEAIVAELVAGAERLLGAWA